MGKPATPSRLEMNTHDPLSAPADPVRVGAACPNCGKGKLDYNGLLELECPACGYVISGGAGCT